MQPSSSSKGFYLDSLPLAPNLYDLIRHGELITDVKQASDFSYSSSSYAMENIRIVGDAGCFIDPLFSSGIHLALVGGLSAAMTIAAVLRGDCSETTAGAWHSSKVADSFNRFLLIVLSAYRQIRSQDQNVLGDADANNLDEAFDMFKPSKSIYPFIRSIMSETDRAIVIQGTSDSTTSIVRADLSKTLDFCANAFHSVQPEDRAAVLQKMKSAVESPNVNGTRPSLSNEEKEMKVDSFRATLNLEEQRALDFIRARQFMHTESSMHLDSYTTDIIDGLKPHLERGNLTLVKATLEADVPTLDVPQLEMVQAIG